MPDVRLLDHCLHRRVDALVLKFSCDVLVEDRSKVISATHPGLRSCDSLTWREGRPSSATDRVLPPNDGSGPRRDWPKDECCCSRARCRASWAAASPMSCLRMAAGRGTTASWPRT